MKKLIITFITLLFVINSVYATKFDDLPQQFKSQITQFLDLDDHKSLRLASKHSYPYDYFYNLENTNLAVTFNDNNVEQLIGKYQQVTKIKPTVFAGQPNQSLYFLQNTNLENMSIKVNLNSNIESLKQLENLILNQVMSKVSYLHLIPDEGYIAKVDDKNRILVAQIIASSEFVKNLQSLNLRDMYITNEGVKILAQSDYLNNVITLILDNNDLTSNGVDSIFGFKNFNNLYYLNLDNNNLRSTHFSKYADKLSSIKKLSLNNTIFYGDLIEEISNLNYLNNLNTLNLAENFLDNKAIKHLANSSNFINLTALNLKASLIGNEGVQYLINSPYLQKLENINIEITRIDDDGINMIAQSKNFNNIKHLKFSDRVTGRSLLYLGNSLIAHNLESLSIDTSEMINMLPLQNAINNFVKLHSFTLKGLDDTNLISFSQTNITNQLYDLDLSDNLLTDKSAQVIIDSKKYQNLNKLNIADNDFTNVGIKEIIRNKPSLKYLNVAGNKLLDTKDQELKYLLKQCNELEDFLKQYHIKLIISTKDLDENAEGREYVDFLEVLQKIREFEKL